MRNLNFLSIFLVLLIILSLVGSNNLLDKFESRGKIEVYDHGCLTNVLNNRNFNNEWIESEIIAVSNPELSGTTFFINDNMDLNTLMHNLILIELIQSNVKLDRIIIQKSPCAKAICKANQNTWEYIFRGWFMATISSGILTGNRDIPIYLRLYDSSKYWRPYRVLNDHLNLDLNNNRINNHGRPNDVSIKTKTKLCFEKVIKSKCNNCFNQSLSLDKIERFRNQAYSIADPQKLPLSLYPTITIVYRSGHEFNRGMVKQQRDALIQMIHIKHTECNVKLLDLGIRSNDENMINEGQLNWNSQVRMMKQSTIIIATHSVFEANIMYMRKGTTFIELLGNYRNAKIESNNYNELAKMFGVNRPRVIVKSMTTARQGNYALNIDEINQILDLISKALIKKKV